MTRRSLFAALAGAIAVDPEKLLWTPGKKLISIPKARPALTRPWIIPILKTLPDPRDGDYEHGDLVFCLRPDSPMKFHLFRLHCSSTLSQWSKVPA